MKICDRCGSKKAVTERNVGIGSEINYGPQTVPYSPILIDQKRELCAACWGNVKAAIMEALEPCANASKAKGADDGKADAE